MLTLVSGLSAASYGGPAKIVPKLEELVKRSHDGDFTVKLFDRAGRAVAGKEIAAFDSRAQRMVVHFVDESGHAAEIPNLNIRGFLKSDSTISKVNTSLEENGRIVKTIIEGHETGPSGELVKYTKVVTAERNVANAMKGEYANEGKASLTSATAQDTVSKKTVKAEVLKTSNDVWIEVRINDGAPVQIHPTYFDKEIISVRPNINNTVDVEVRATSGIIEKYTYKIDNKKTTATQISRHARDINYLDDRSFEINKIKGSAVVEESHQVRNLNLHTKSFDGSK
jgi:hypothetical protein